MIYVNKQCIYSILAAVSSSSSSSSTVNDPNSDNSSSNTSNSNSGGGLSKGALIGICVSVGAVVYAAATVVAIQVYRRRRTAKEEKAIAEHQLFAQSISEPIMQENSLGWSGPSHFGGVYNHTRQPYENQHQW
jgi:beta-lactamase regulating signal transducer with metallopeptidase domain